WQISPDGAFPLRLRGESLSGPFAVSGCIDPAHLNHRLVHPFRDGVGGTAGMPPVRPPDRRRQLPAGDDQPGSWALCRRDVTGRLRESLEPAIADGIAIDRKLIQFDDMDRALIGPTLVGSHLELTRRDGGHWFGIP